MDAGNLMDVDGLVLSILQICTKYPITVIERPCFAVLETMELLKFHTLGSQCPLAARSTQKKIVAIIFSSQFNHFQTQRACFSVWLVNDLFKWFSNTESPTHYDCGRLLAVWLFRVVNIKKNVEWLNGVKWT